MTVCVAAVCENTITIGMSDRMLTAGDVQFQPPSSKIWPITRSIVMMAAGDVGLQTEIHTEVQAVVMDRIRTEPGRWWRVSEVADLYGRAYSGIKQRKAEKEILMPLGLNNGSFLAGQQSMDRAFVADISRRLIGYDLPDVAAIIVGNNPSSSHEGVITPHLFRIENGVVSCADLVGFACVGAGAWHANSTFMLAGHTPRTPVTKALLTTYAAKKRAEVAPGVGPETDTFVITGALGSYATLNDDVVAATRKAYEQRLRLQHKAEKKAEESLKRFMDELFKPKPEEQQPLETTPGEPSNEAET